MVKYDKSLTFQSWKVNLTDRPLITFRTFSYINFTKTSPIHSKMTLKKFFEIATKYEIDRFNHLSKLWWVIHVRTFIQKLSLSL